MKRRAFIFAALVSLAVPAPWIGSNSGRVPMPRMFALVYRKNTKEPIRLVDTSDEADDSHLYRAQKFLAADEVMELFPQHVFKPVNWQGRMIRWPRFVTPFIGQGTVI